MDKLSFKYYTISAAIAIVISSSLAFLGFNNLIAQITKNFCSEAKQIISLIMSLFSVATIAYLLNHYCFGIMRYFLGLPDLRGNYTGKLESSYHVDDDESKPHITKYVKISISQNVNGFYVEAFFYEHEASLKHSSESYSVSHDIDKKPNNEYIITYRYKNKADKLHDDHEKYGLTDHDGITILTFNAKNKTLNGKYFNDSQNRPSYGNLNLTKNNKL
jgi:hypothetical protein